MPLAPGPTLVLWRSYVRSSSPFRDPVKSPAKVPSRSFRAVPLPAGLPEIHEFDVPQLKLIASQPWLDQHFSTRSEMALFPSAWVSTHKKGLTPLTLQEKAIFHQVTGCIFWLLPHLVHRPSRSTSRRIRSPRVRFSKPNVSRLAPDFLLAHCRPHSRACSEPVLLRHELPVVESPLSADDPA